ncbi:MADCA protein, partial [Ramphastos sulfuratus]|nr:MADCA protein [Ramphastos sulfuratus]
LGTPSLIPVVSSFFHPGQPSNRLAVMPQELVVQYGGSVQLNCSLACTGGTVQWRGLDANLGSITSFPTHSILHISSARVATEGTKICQGTCHGQLYQRSVNLKVYVLPDMLQLETEPRALEPGQPGSLHCSAQGIYPSRELGLTWYLGDQVLKEDDFEITEVDEMLFNIVSILSVEGEKVAEGAEFRCEVKLSIGQETFTRVASVTVSTGALTITREPLTETILELAAATKPHSTEHPAPQDLTTGSLTAHSASTTSPGSSMATAPAEAPATATRSISRGTVPAVEGAATPEGTMPACSLQIWSLPPKGTRGRALRIECQALCARNVTIRWLQTPVALSQYRQEVAGGSSALRLDRAEPQHQGYYQCVLLGHRSPAVGLRLLVLDDSSSTVPAIATGTTLSLLGLIVTGVVSHRLRKRSRYELH